MKLAFDDIGKGAPVVFLHAFPLSRTMWNQTASSLSTEGYRVITPDLRGFGESENGDALYKIADMASDVAELLEHLGIQRAIIGGLSMGGYVTFNLFRLYPEKFAGLVFCDTKPDAESDETLEIRYQLIKNIEDQGSQALADQLLPHLVSEHTISNNPRLISKLTREFLSCPPQSAIAATRGIAERKDHRYILNKIDIPTLLIFGEHDKITNLEIAKSMNREILDSKLVIIKNSGHYSNLEQPIAFNSALLNFIGQVKI